MTQSTLSIDHAGLDAVLPFQVEPLDVRGRTVQLGPMLDTILDRHQYPVPVARLLAEAITLTVLLGTALKFEGKFILQTQTNGPVSMIVTDFQTPDSIRAYARYDESAVAALNASDDDCAALLGKGILAMTIDQGSYMQRYQGIVQLDGIGLEEVARQYFKQSEQIPTEVRLAVAEVITRRPGDQPKHAWSAGGVLVQFLPDSEERRRQKDLDGGDGSTEQDFQEDDAWTETRLLMQTIDDLELTDATVRPENLLYRLFNEHGVRVFEPIDVKDQCSCSETKVRDMLSGLTSDDRAESVESGEIQVVCEFCSENYSFDPESFGETG